MKPSSSASPVPILERAARNERWIVLTGLTLVAATGLFATLRLGDMLIMPSAFVGGAIVYLGAFRMGLSHELYCLGCCWVLMGLLFYGGVMELRWIVGLALYVAAEKLIPAGNRLSRFTGILLIGWGAWKVYRALG